jgi:hypothetical protein
MIVSDTPNCGITFDHHYDDRNSFKIQAKLCHWQRKKFLMIMRPDDMAAEDAETGSADDVTGSKSSPSDMYLKVSAF